MRAFVLAGGASLGATQVGMLRALYEREIAPDVLVATSAGAVNAAYLASRPATPQTAADLRQIWSGLHRATIFPLNPFNSVRGFLGRSDHLVSDAGLRHLIEQYIEFERLEQAPIPLHVIATELLSGLGWRLSHGPAVDAVLASSAIPGVFPPVDWNGTLLIDGGVVDNTPVTHAVELGADEIYVLPTGFSCAPAAHEMSALSMALQAVGLMIHQRLVADIERVGDSARLIVLPPPCPVDVQPIDFSHADELADAAYLPAVRALKHPERHAGAPSSIRPHAHARAGTD